VIRRLMRVTLLLTGILVLRAETAKTVQRAGIHPVFAKHGIKIERVAEAPGAEARLGRLVGPEVAAQISPTLKPHLLLVENASNVAITEIHSVLYRYTGPGAQGIPGIDAMKLGPNGIPPGDFFIIGGPLTRPLMDKAKRGVTPPGLAQSQAEFVANNLDARRFPFAETTIDAIVLADGRVLGPDRSGVVAQQQASINAIKQVLAKLEDRSLDDAALKQWLAEASVRRGAVLKADHMPDYTQARLSGFAAIVSQRLQAVGREQTIVNVAGILARQTASNTQFVAVKE
jgi:hypothetical protein